MGTWACPNDRQLALRAKLGAGWSIHTSSSSPFAKSEQLTQEETEKILKVIRQAEKVDQIEMARIGHLVEKFEIMRTSASGDGSSQCVLCCDEFRILGASPTRCSDCKKSACSKCGVDTMNSKLQPIHLCKICSESRELWRKSGAWFYRGMPSFVRPMNSKMTSVARTLKSPWIGEPLPEDGGHHLPLHLDAVQLPPPTFTKFMKANRGNNSDSSSEDEVNVIRKRARPQQSESDSDISQAAGEAKESRSQSVNPSNYEEPIKIEEPVDDNIQQNNSNNAQNNHNIQQNNGNIQQNNNNNIQQKSINTRRPTLEFTPRQISDHTTPDEDLNSVPETPASLGMVEFSLLYNSKDKLLKCTMHRAKNLPAMDKNGFSDPYVKLHMLPGVDKATKRRTKTIPKTKDPEWNEVLEYHGITEDDMRHKTVRLAVYDEDKIGSDFIGETRVNLKSLPHDVTKEFSNYLSGLQVRTGKEDNGKPLDRGRLFIGLMYSSVGEKLVVSIKRCANLTPMDSNGLSDPYVKIYLMPDKEKKTKHKTKVKTKTLNPEFNEDFSYSIKLAELTKKILEVSVWDKDFGRNEFIGSIQFGPDSEAAELRHWLEVLKRPNEMVEQWHVLKNVVVCPNKK